MIYQADSSDKYEIIEDYIPGSLTIKDEQWPDFLYWLANELNYNYKDSDVAFEVLPFGDPVGQPFLTLCCKGEQVPVAGTTTYRLMETGEKEKLVASDTAISLEREVFEETLRLKIKQILLNASGSAELPFQLRDMK